MNMGILSLQLEKLIHPKTMGKFEICPAIIDKPLYLKEKHTGLEELTYRDGKIYSGFLTLSEPKPNSKFGAYLSLDSPR
jgi:hypothetical protein